VNVFYLKETARWSYIVKNASANDIAVIIDQAMADIEDSNPPLKGALPLNLFATLGADKSKIKDLIDNVNQISEERFKEEDLIGRVYEYFLQVYAASGTKEDGEFYTPACVVKLIAEMIEPYSGVVYDKAVTGLIQRIPQKGLISGIFANGRPTRSYFFALSPEMLNAVGCIIQRTEAVR